MRCMESVKHLDEFQEWGAIAERRAHLVYSPVLSYSYSYIYDGLASLKLDTQVFYRGDLKCR